MLTPPTPVTDRFYVTCKWGTFVSRGPSKKGFGFDYTKKGLVEKSMVLLQFFLSFFLSLVGLEAGGLSVNRDQAVPEGGSTDRGSVTNETVRQMRQIPEREEEGRGWRRLRFREVWL